MVIVAVVKSGSAAKVLDTVSKLIVSCMAIRRTDSSNLPEVLKYLARIFRA